MESLGLALIIFTHLLAFILGMLVMLWAVANGKVYRYRSLDPGQKYKMPE